MKEKYSLNEDLVLTINVGENKLGITDDLLSDIRAKIFFFPDENFSESITNLKLSDSKIHFKFKGEQVELLEKPIECKLSKENKTISIFSLTHFNLIIQKIKYNSPYYIQDNKKIFLNNNNISLPEQEESIEIKELTKNEQLLFNFYYDQSVLYSKTYKLGNSTYEFISFNYKDYFRINVDKSKKFFYITSAERSRMYKEIKRFISDNEANEKILAFCGPYGIGKSVSSLYIQKELYITEKKNSLYINLKYFYNNSFSFDEKRLTLLKECYFIINNSQKHLLDIYSLLNEDKKDIWIMIDIIINYLFNQNKKDFFLIIDQYKKKFDENNNLKSLKQKIKVVILSSINDKDVKLNLMYKFKREIKKPNTIDEDENINYNYLISLVKINEMMLNGFFNNKTDEKSTFIKNILKNIFGNLPKYIDLYLYLIKNIYDLYYTEYIKIFKNIDLVLQKCIDNEFFNKINENKDFSKEYFYDHLMTIPLKYINYQENEQGNTISLFYSFQLTKTVIDDYTLFLNRLNSFYSENNPSTKGNHFEGIVITMLKVYGRLKVEGYFEVDKLINMKLTAIYSFIKADYFKNKDVILINQEIKNAELYDFALYKVKENNLILFQSKYIISDKNVLPKNDYIESSKKIKELFKKIFDIELKGVYLLYVSSFEYNQNNKKCSTILKNKELNCIFYSTQEKDFFINNVYKIDDINCEEEFRLIPPSTKYYNKLYEFEKIIGCTFKKKKKLYPDSNIKGDMEFNCKEEYKKFIDYINKECLINEEITKYLGDFISYFPFCFGEFKDPDEGPFIYYVIFSVKVKNENSIEIDYDKDLGLIYYDDNQQICYFNIKNPLENYNKNNKNDFIIKFYCHCLVKGIWTKYLNNKNN